MTARDKDGRLEQTSGGPYRGRVVAKIPGPPAPGRPWNELTLEERIERVADKLVTGDGRPCRVAAQEATRARQVERHLDARIDALSKRVAELKASAKKDRKAAKEALARHKVDHETNNHGGRIHSLEERLDEIEAALIPIVSIASMPEAPSLEQHERQSLAFLAGAYGRVCKLRDWYATGADPGEHDFSNMQVADLLTHALDGSGPFAEGGRFA